ncbi:hypothetical protein EDC01DRAFT_634092 [Geopyxis carbonaria]|nr:hypothetical protein EDC01DRAFT_634092 [Geopyxis carbonaria]
MKIQLYFGSLIVGLLVVCTGALPANAPTVSLQQPPTATVLDRRDDMPTPIDGPWAYYVCNSFSEDGMYKHNCHLHLPGEEKQNIWRCYDMGNNFFKCQYPYGSDIFEMPCNRNADGTLACGEIVGDMRHQVQAHVVDRHSVV